MPQAARRRRPIAEPLAVAWPLALFAAMAGLGSAYARSSLGYDSTFLVYGLYAGMLFLSAAMMLVAQAPHALLRAYFWILVPAALYMSALLLANTGVRQVYHEEIFLVIPMAALAFASRRGAFVRWGGALFFLSMGYFSHKLTSYLLGAAAAAYLALFIWLPRLRMANPLAKAAAVYWGALAILSGVGAAALYAFSRDEGAIPTGNLDFRLHTYQAALGRFLDSPLWGSWFIREAAEKFTLFDVGVGANVLPTHSDLLDLLANGGLLGFALVAGGLCAIWVHAWRRLLRPAAIERPDAPYAHALALMTIGALLVAIFNPIMLQPQMAALVWSNLGMLLGLSLRADD
jgi:O-antigen ligase